MQKTTIRKITQATSMLLSIIFFISTLCNDKECNSKIYLSLHFTPRCSTSKKESENSGLPAAKTISIYHKGEKRHAHITSLLGNTLHITEDRFVHTISIIITTKVKTRMRGAKVVGLMLPHDAEHAYYKLCYTVNNDGVSYHWTIEPVDAQSQRIPDDAIVIIEHPEHVSIEPFDDSFSPSCPLSGKHCYGVVILPTIYIDQCPHKNVPTVGMSDIDQCHIVR